MSDSWPLLPLIPEPPSTAMSVAEWFELEEDQPGELVRGQLTEEEVPDATHDWLVDAALGSVEIFELVDGRYAKALGVTGGVVTQIPGCPGLGLDVDALWRELARLPEA